VARRRQNGRHSICRQCKSEYDRAYREKNAARIAANQAIYGKNNREKQKIKLDKWRAANVERDRSTKRAYQVTHAVKIAVYQREWREANADHLKQYHANYRREHPEMDREKLRRRRSAKRGVKTGLMFSEWKEILHSYGGRCVYCGKSANSQDHIVPLANGGTHTADNVVPACVSCNATKQTRSLLLFMHYRLMHG
jgi:5-methylcytosine-specific restriction endonuclease McrA